MQLHYYRRKNLIDSILLAVQPTVADTSTWSWSGSLVMNICILLGIIIARVGIQNKGKGPGLPLLEPILGKNFGLPELLAGISFGHILGVGAILGLTNTGLIT
jgi:photosystem I subunit 10